MWLTKAFLRFSTRSKNKADQVVPAPPPHSIYTAGTWFVPPNLAPFISALTELAPSYSDLEIGPHLFPQTKIFFIQYQYTHPSTPAPAPIPTPTPTSAPVAPPVSSSTPAQHVAPITVSHELHTRVRLPSFYPLGPILLMCLSVSLVYSPSGVFSVSPPLNPKRTRNESWV